MSSSNDNAITTTFLALASGALLGATAALLLGRRVFRKGPEDKPEPLFI